MSNHPVTTVKSLLSAVSLLFILSSCGSSGNGPQFGNVTGTITLDGAPLPFAKVEFQPEKARPSVGLTNENGQYTLGYSVAQKGAIQGQHVVRIALATPDEVGGEDSKAIVELRKRVKIPDRFNKDSGLTAEVKKGNNNLNFELTSK